MENDLGRIMPGKRIRSSAALLSELQRDCINLIVFETRTIEIIQQSHGGSEKAVYLQLTPFFL